MTQVMGLKFLLLLIIAVLIQNSETIESNSNVKACSDGSEAAKTGKSCLDPSNEMFEICCKACLVGINIAKRGNECDQNVKGEPEFHQNIRMACCNEKRQDLLLDVDDYLSGEDDVYDEDNEDYVETTTLVPKLEPYSRMPYRHIASESTTEIPHDFIAEYLIKIDNPELTSKSTENSQKYVLDHSMTTYRPISNHYSAPSPFASYRAPPILRNPNIHQNIHKQHSYVHNVHHRTQNNPKFQESTRNIGSKKESCTGNGYCQHECLIVGNMQKCLCKFGYALNNDGRTCRPINIHKFTPVILRNSKYCGRGLFRNDFGYCEDIDECKIANNACGQRFYCKNTRGGFECLPKDLCMTGFKYNERKNACEDINECLEIPPVCDNQKICNNTFGGYTCEENYAEFRKRECEVFRYPETSTEKVATTTSIITTTTQRRSTRTTNKPRIWIVDGAPPNITKINECPKGFERNERGACVDINECLNPLLYKCQPEEECVNHPGYYRCVKSSCAKGLKFVGGRCDDVNECESNPCPHTHNCINTFGSYKCKQKRCEYGYELNSSGDCVDSDECAKSPDICRNGVCINTPGSYECQCLDGFRRFDRNYCRDVNECAEGIHHCDQLCRNTFGGYRCGCKSGYKLNWNNRTCDDVDECFENGEDLCTGDCVNTKGGYECTCPSGFTKINNGYCQDIDECEDGSSQCNGDMEHCVNTAGSHECMYIGCDPGYRYSIRGNFKYCQLQATCDVDNEDDLCNTKPWKYSINFMSKTANCSAGNLFHFQISPNIKYEAIISQFHAEPANDRVNIAEKSDFSINIIESGIYLAVNAKLDGPQDIEVVVLLTIFRNDDSVEDKRAFRVNIFVSKYTSSIINSRKYGNYVRN